MGLLKIEMKRRESRRAEKEEGQSANAQRCQSVGGQCPSQCHCEWASEEGCQWPMMPRKSPDLVTED